MEQIESILPCFDFFGTKPSFYTEGQPKLYSFQGGFLFILSTVICISLYVTYSFEDFRQINPITTTSSIPSEGYRKVKIDEEKIWIPWRIVDNNDKYVNHTNLIYPEIINYYGESKNYSGFNMNTKKLNYKLCNETTMINMSDIYKFDLPLDQVYCIDMDTIEIGGFWISDFINYINFNLYYCNDGIDYDPENSNCTNDKKIIETIGENNSLYIDIYYPVVQFQPMNKTNPIIVIYRQYFYYFSRYLNKVDRLYLQEYVLSDDLSYFTEKIINSTYWGFSSIEGENYFTGKSKELISEGSTSKIYSINLYLEPGIIHYKRHYKKIYQSVSEWLPIIYIIFVLFKNIAKILKTAEVNKKLFELLFENLKERPDKFKLFSDEMNKISKKNNIKRQINKTYLKRNFMNNLRNYAKSKPNNLKEMESIQSSNKIVSFNINANNIILKKQTKTSNKFNENDKIKIQKPLGFVDKQYINNNITGTLDKLNIIEPPNNFLQLSKVQCQKKMTFRSSNANLKKNRKSISSMKKPIPQNEKEAPKVQFIKRKLFPYTYYLNSVIFSRFKIQKNCLYSNKFAKVYNFVAKFLDISTYLILLRQFQFIKNNFFNRRDLHRIEENNKINVNKENYFRDADEGINCKEIYLNKLNNKKFFDKKVKKNKNEE